MADVEKEKPPTPESTIREDGKNIDQGKLADVVSTRPGDVPPQVAASGDAAFTQVKDAHQYITEAVKDVSSLLQGNSMEKLQAAVEHIAKNGTIEHLQTAVEAHNKVLTAFQTEHIGALNAGLDFHVPKKDADLDFRPTVG